MSDCIDTWVNWVSELLQTAVASSPVILLSVHVHMCMYSKPAEVLEGELFHLAVYHTQLV